MTVFEAPNPRAVDSLGAEIADERLNGDQRRWMRGEGLPRSVLERVRAMSTDETTVPPTSLQVDVARALAEMRHRVGITPPAEEEPAPTPAASADALRVEVADTLAAMRAAVGIA